MNFQNPEEFQSKAWYENEAEAIFQAIQIIARIDSYGRHFIKEKFILDVRHSAKQISAVSMDAAKSSKN